MNRLTESAPRQRWHQTTWARWLRPPLLRIALSVIVVTICMPSVADDDDTVLDTGDAALDAIFEQFIDARSDDDKLEALQALTNSDRDDKRTLLLGVLNSDLLFWKDESRLVWVEEDGRDYIIKDLMTREKIGQERKRRVKRLSIDNQLRTDIRGLLATLTLRSEDPAQRLRATRALFEAPENIESSTLDELVAQEQDANVSAALQMLTSLKQLTAEDPLERRAGIADLTGELSPELRRTIRDLALNDPDEDVRQDAADAQSLAEARVRFFGHLETLFFGLSLGSVLVLAAIGLAITFGVMGVINMAHGELIMLGAYTAWGMQQLMPQSLGLALLLSIPAAFLLTGIVGILIERGVIRFLYGRPLETLLATFGISLILQQAVRTFVSPQNVPVANPEFMSGVLQINGAFSLTLNRVYILVFCLLVFVVLLQLLKRTRLGLEVRAVSQNRGIARAMGVKAARVDALTFGLGAGIAGIAGVALSQLTNVGPNLGQAYIVDSFMVVVFGGVGNLWGTLIGGMTLGVANKLMEPWAGAILAKILVLVFLIAFIQKRPRGLFPQRGRAAEA